MTVVLTDELMRRKSNKARVLDLLRERGQAGAYNFELVAVGGMRAVGARLVEIRADGHDVETINEGDGLFKFRLHEPARVKGPQPGEAGYLASLEPVASIYDTHRPQHAVDSEGSADSGRLF